MLWCVCVCLCAVARKVLNFRSQLISLLTNIVMDGGTISFEENLCARCTHLRSVHICHSVCRTFFRLGDDARSLIVRDASPFGFSSKHLCSLVRDGTDMGALHVLDHTGCICRRNIQLDLNALGTNCYISCRPSRCNWLEK